MKELYITSFGKFTLTYGDRSVSETDNRSRKIWRLIKYIAANRPRHISQDELISLLGTADNNDAFSSLKTMLHRARNLLKELELEGGACLILQDNGHYYWNCDFPQVNDEDRFKALVTRAVNATSREDCFEIQYEAIRMYGGFYMDKAFDDIPVLSDRTRRYHSMAIKFFDMVTTFLYEKELYRKIIKMSEYAISIDPYQELFHYQLIRSCIAISDHAAAERYYFRVNELFMGKFRVNPSDRIRSLYRYIAVQKYETRDCLKQVRDDLLASNRENTAIYCEYDTFRLICNALYSINCKRGYDSLRLIMFSVSPKSEASLPAEGHVSAAMKSLYRILGSYLMPVELYSRYSINQYTAIIDTARHESCEQLFFDIQAAFCEPECNASLKLEISSLELIPTAQEQEASNL